MNRVDTMPVVASSPAASQQEKVRGLLAGSTIQVIGLTTLALAVRILLAARSGLWRDEALFLFVVRSPSWTGMLDFLRFHESHPPLFYAMMRLWLSVTGDTDAAALAVPVVIGVALVPLIYVVGTSLFSSRVGVLAAAFVAISPSLSDYSSQVRPYSLLPLLALLSCYALIRGIERGGRTPWFAYVLSTLALLYTHNWSWLVLAGEWAAVGVVITVGSDRPRVTMLRDWLVAQVMIAIGYLPWAHSLVFQTRHAGHEEVVIRGASDIVQFFAFSARALLQSTVLASSVEDGGMVDPLRGRLFVALPIIVLCVGQFLRIQQGYPVRTTRRSDAAEPGNLRERTALLVLVVVPIATWLSAMMLSPRSNMILSRCLVTLAPPMLLALAFWLGSQRTRQMMPLAPVVVATLLATYATSGWELMQTTRSNAKELALTVTANSRPSDLLIIAPEWIASSFNRYYGPNVEQIDFPEFGREGAIRFTAMRDRTVSQSALIRVKRRITEARRDERRVWLIIESAYVHEFTTEGITRALQAPGYIRPGIARANQVRAELVSQYGPPNTSFSGDSRRPQLEELQAFLFIPP